MKIIDSNAEEYFTFRVIVEKDGQNYLVVFDYDFWMNEEELLKYVEDNFEQINHFGDVNLYNGKGL